MDFFEMCKTGHLEEILSKIREGIDVNIRDENGWTPLMYAAWYNQNPEVVKILLEAGADAKLVDDFGKKAIDYAKKNDFLLGTSVYKQLEEASG
jgi:ankyrin repeat protein